MPTTALVILPTGTYRAAEYLEAAARLGVDVVTASERAQALAGTMGDRFLELPLSDPVRSAELIVERSAAVSLDAVIAVDDQGLLAASLAAERLGLRHSPPAAVRLTRDKAGMREAFLRAGVPQPGFAVVSSDPAEVAEAGRRLGFPVVVKPTSLSASRGVIRADAPGEAAAAARRIAPILAEAGEPVAGPLVVERFVPGPEVSVEGILVGGELTVVTIFDKPDPLDGPFFEERLYLSPSRLQAEAAAAVAGVVRSAVQALGLTEGPVHAELRLPGQLDPAGAPEPPDEMPPIQMIEIAARTIGGRCSKAFVLEDGSSLEELVIAAATGIRLPTPRLGGPSGVLMVPIARSGTLCRVDRQDEVRALPHVTGVEITIPPGRTVHALPEGDRYLGFVFAAAHERDDVESALRRAEELLDVVIEPAGEGLTTDGAGRDPDGGQVP